LGCEQALENSSGRGTVTDAIVSARARLTLLAASRLIPGFSPRAFESGEKSAT
jgi:hypothetical protein